MFKPLKRLLKVMDDKMKVFDVNTNLETGLAAVKWGIDHKQSQQGLTALEESIKTFLCNEYGLNEKKKRDREDICKSVCNELSYAMQTGHVKVLTEAMREEICASWMETRQTMFSYMAEEEQTFMQETVKKIFYTIPDKLVLLCKNISDIRNSMNHFGYSNPGQFDSSLLDSRLKTCRDEFLKIMEEMKNSVTD